MPAKAVGTFEFMLGAVVLILATTGCGFLSSDGQQQQQAQAILDRWAAATRVAGDQGVALVGELTGQVGNWEPAVGDNNKPALMAGLIQTRSPLSTDIPPTGKVVWEDGYSRTVDLVSASDAESALAAAQAADGGSPCQSCEPLEVTGATLGMASVTTTRGPATAPAWLFSLAGTDVKLSQVAVANEVSVVPPVSDSGSSEAGISIDGAAIARDDRQLTVSFEGATLTGDKTCGVDYTALAVESDLAVVVIVDEHPNLMPAFCAGFGGTRTAVTTLASPLGHRAVLEVTQGLQVPVTRQ